MERYCSTENVARTIQFSDIYQNFEDGDLVWEFLDLRTGRLQNGEEFETSLHSLRPETRISVRYADRTTQAKTLWELIDTLGNAEFVLPDSLEGMDPFLSETVKTLSQFSSICIAHEPELIGEVEDQDFSFDESMEQYIESGEWFLEETYGPAVPVGINLSDQQTEILLRRWVGNHRPNPKVQRTADQERDEKIASAIWRAHLAEEQGSSYQLAKASSTWRELSLPEYADQITNLFLARFRLQDDGMHAVLTSRAAALCDRYQKGHSEAGREFLKEALECNKAALKLMPKNAYTFKQMHRVYVLSGQTQLAVAALIRVFELESERGSDSQQVSKAISVEISKRWGAQSELSKKLKYELAVADAVSKGRLPKMSNLPFEV